MCVPGDVDLCIEEAKANWSHKYTLSHLSVRNYPSNGFKSFKYANCYTVTLLRLQPAAYQGLPNPVPNAVAKEDYLKRGTSGYCLEVAWKLPVYGFVIG